MSTKWRTCAVGCETVSWKFHEEGSSEVGPGGLAEIA